METELEKMEKQVEAVIARMNQLAGTKRMNSLTVLASKFAWWERRCLELAKTSSVNESGEMIRYEIMNPSDKCFIEGTDFKTVCIATILLGEGKYGLQQSDEKNQSNQMPPIIFAKGWFLETFGEHANLPEVTKAMKIAHEIMVGNRDLYQCSFNAYVQKGHFIINCPGDACGLHPADWYSHEGHGYEFSCHNVDSAIQQVTLLVGLAALNDMARRESK